MIELLVIAALQAPERPVARAVWVDARALVVDGDGSEWRDPGPAQVVLERAEQLVALGGRAPLEAWTGPEDASLRLWLGWTPEDLVLYGEVRDEIADHDPARWFQGDSLELFLNARDRDPRWGADDYQVMLAPNWPDRPWGVYPREGQGGAPRSSDGGFGGVELFCQPMEGGYRFEARLPWRNFGGLQVRGGAALPFNVAQCDRDGRGPQESYLTWTGEADVAAFADRRGELLLEPAPASAGRAAAATAGPSVLASRWVLLVVLASTCAFALATRRMWRRPRAKAQGLTAAAAIVLCAGGVALAARYAGSSEREERRRDLEQRWSRFEALLRSGGLGHPEPARLMELADALLDHRAIAPLSPARFLHLAPAGARVEQPLATARRAIPYAPIRAAQAESEAPAGVELAPGDACVLELDAPEHVDAVHLVTHVTDRRHLRVGEQRSVLAVELLRHGAPVAEPREVRHRQDLHHEEDDHRDHPGLEPAFYAPGGRMGSVHGDGLLLELGAPREVDRVVVRHVGAEPGYRVRLVAAAVRAPRLAGAPPPGLRTTASGEWEWADWSPSLAAEVLPLGRRASTASDEEIVRGLRIGSEPVGVVLLRSAAPPPRPSRWDFAPLLALACLAPFLVAILAEWLATRRRIRGKLAAGFAVSSAVPLLALTLLLQASLAQEHERAETERARTALARARADLDLAQRELEREARRLLRIAELTKRIEGRFPETPTELETWWGDGEGALRILERTGADGRRVRVGSGPGWQQVPPAAIPGSGLVRPWGQLLVCGVAQTASGAGQPLAVVVAELPRLPGAHGSAPDGGAPAVRLLGAGRDPAPTYGDLQPATERELRLPLYGPRGEELAGVLVATRRERGAAVLGPFTLTQLLVAAAITALFTVLLFAGILTGHIVGPIERLHRAVRSGRTAAVEPEVDDEIGHLTGAIRAFTTELEQRVLQLETLRLAQEDLSRRLDPDPAREAVLRFFGEQSGARRLLLAWEGGGEEPRLFALDEGGAVSALPLPEQPGLVHQALRAAEVLDLAGSEVERALRPAERALLGDVARVVCLPLAAGGRSRGALVLGLASASAPLDLAFLRAATGPAAVVLENASLYQQAVRDPATGFLSEPGFRQRLAQEIERAGAAAGSGVLLVQVRLTALPADDQRATERLRECARRLRAAVRGQAVFGRAGSADLKLALAWSGRRPDPAGEERRIVERLAALPWPDGEPVAGVLSSHAEWPRDGRSARQVTSLLEERLAELQAHLPVGHLEAVREQLPPDFVAASPAMVQVLDTVRRLAQQELTVLIAGETGVGKDRVAELVHRWSPRRDGPLVHIHCPSLAGSLIEDELFGHEKGAFTGAHGRRIGPFAYAAGGTVVLDEVGGLAPEGQVALLRLLQSREVLPLGATRAVPIDVRVVATTSRDLAAEVEQGRFRGDLYFRLNVAQITVPPLRLRRQDLPELVEAFVRRFNASALRPVTGVDPRLVEALLDHDWPGNVRELENLLARGATLAGGGELGLEHVEDPTALEPRTGAGSPGPLNPRQEGLLERLATGQRITTSEHAARSGISERTALRDLLELVERGLLVREGRRRGTRFQRTGRGFAAPRGH